MKKTHSIKTKIVVLAIVPMLLISVILLVYAFVGGIMNTNSALTDSIRETAKISAQAITNQLVVYETAVNEAASNELFRNASSDNESIMQFLNEVKERNGFLRIGYTDESGVNQNGSDFSERQYFKDCRETLKPVTSDPYASKDGNGALSVLFCAPILRNGSFGGIVYGAADAKLFTDIIASVIVGKDGKNFIIDSTGTFIAHNDYSIASNLENYIEQAKTDASLSGQAAIVSEMLKNRTGSMVYNDGKMQRIMCYVPIEKGSSWVLAVTVSYFEFIGNQLVGLSVLAAAAAAVIAVSIILILKTSARIVKPVRSCTKRIELLAEGDLKSDMPDMVDFKSDDETGVLVESTRRNIRHLNSMIRHISDSLEQMAAGDFTHETEGKFRGDFAPIKASLDNIVGSLHSVLADIDSASAAMSEISEQVVDTSCSLADGVNHQTELIGQISDTFEEMKESIKLNAENTANVLELASKTKSGVKTSGNQMNELLEAMREMEKLSKEIRSINDTISDIAFQTHILAINASIEAAAVGEAGKGFTVVANEVGHLSAKCAESVSKTTALIERTVKAINDGTRLAETVSESFGDVEADTAEVEKNIADISASSQEQAERIESVSEKMNTISSVVETTAVSSEKSAEISEKLKDEAESLKNIVSGFTLKKSQNP
ncbi:MAG: methyl-accepting chemotaxis protein [Oscillospiraceae bacterium]